MNEFFLNKLETMLDKDRLSHSIGVCETAKKLAEINNADVKKAEIAGLIHDCAKCFSDEKLIEIAKKNGIEIDDVSRAQPNLLHGPVGAIIAKEEFLVDDEETLNSIKYHTTGCENMSLLDKIIYLADYIEPNRHFPNVYDIRRAAYKNIDEGLMLALNNTIEFVIKRGLLIDIKTIKARNSLIIDCI